jgi:hypothetical protein
MCRSQTGQDIGRKIVDGEDFVAQRIIDIVAAVGNPVTECD